MKTLKVLGFLLTYPSLQHQDVAEECRHIMLQENILSDSAKEGVYKLLFWFENTPIEDIQESYVDLFDRTPSLSLHLFEHVHGDSRSRGQALVDLNDVYVRSGLMISTEEMPDYLPLFLEYLSTRSSKDASQDITDAIDVIGAIGERLKQRKSLYAGVFDALIAIAGRKPDLSVIAKAITKSDGQELSAEQIDKEWVEQFAFENTPQTTGGNNCPAAMDMVRRMNAPIIQTKKT